LTAVPLFDATPTENDLTRSREKHTRSKFVFPPFLLEHVAYFTASIRVKEKESLVVGFHK
jgi:hypothetical protein